MGKRRRAQPSFTDALVANQDGHPVAEEVVEGQGGKTLSITDLEATKDTVPAEGKTEIKVPKKKAKRSYANAYVRKGEGLDAIVKQIELEKNKLLDQSAAELASKSQAVQAPAKPSNKRSKKAEKDADIKLETDTDVKAEAIKAPKRRQRKAAKVDLAGDQPEILNGGTKANDAGVSGEAKTEEQPKKRRRGPDPNAFKVPPPEVLKEAQGTVLADRPVPNTGFACLNATLRAQKPPMFTNRGCVKKTFEEKGLDWISQLCLDNCKDLAGLIQWNHLNGIRFFRMSSCIFPWCTDWDFKQLKNQEAIKDALKFAGDLARAYDQRLTFHPSHFVKLGCPESPLLDRSLHELEQHSLILDLMGYEPSHWNKVNIHIGGMYGDKEGTIDRFAENFKRLSSNCQKRLTVENDDSPNAYSLQDLLRLHEKAGIPLVFDFHHHKFCPGEFTEEEAFKRALATWPKGVRPVVHWSESQEGRKPFAHSDFVKGPLRLYGLEDEVDVMIEAKGKELALLKLRDPSYTPSAAALALVYGPPPKAKKDAPKGADKPTAETTAMALALAKP